MKIAQLNLTEIEKKGLSGFNFSGSKIGDIISGLIPYIFAAAGFSLLIYLVIGGLEFMFSMGDPKKTQAARGKITNALLGFLVVFAAYLIVEAVALVFGITDISNIFK